MNRKIFAPESVSWQKQMGNLNELLQPFFAVTSADEFKKSENFTRQGLAALFSLHGFLMFELPNTPSLGLGKFQREINRYLQIRNETEQFLAHLQLLNISNDQFSELIGKRF